MQKAGFLTTQLIVATCYTVHDVETIFYLRYTNSIWKSCLNMSDARETASCTFLGITHISENDVQMLLVVNIP